MADAPKSYRDPIYASLDARITDKLGLPPGLLDGIRTNGERSNADQISEAGARTVYQIIPQTRDAAIKKWGIDAYLSPENAAEVAGLLLKDSLDRNSGNVSQAVAEYHGGTDRGQWGGRTRSYVNRVMVGLRQAQPQSVRPQSTFDRITAARAPETPQIAQIFAAYQDGRMTPQERADFEQDVQSGALMLPRGAQLSTPQTPPSGQQLPDGVVQAYLSGKLSPQEKAELEQDINAGVVSLPPGVAMQTNGNTMAEAIPGQDLVAPPSDGTSTPTPPQSFGDRIIGGLETAANLGTGMTTGALGAVTGAGSGLVQAIQDGTFGTQEGVNTIGRAAEQAAGNLTYAPRTAAGREMAQGAGELLASTLPVAPLTGELAALARGAQAVQPSAAVAIPVAQAGARQALEVAQRGGQAVADRARAMVGREPAQPTPGTMGSAGAAGTDVALMRREAARELPAPIDLTTGQATRNRDQLQFEGETAKMQKAGERLRQRYAEQNQAILRNFDAWVDQTGAEAPTLRATGSVVDQALVNKSKRDKTEVNVKYAAARRSDEAKLDVNQSMPITVGEGDSAITATPLGWINEHPSGLPATALVDAARQYAEKIGIARRDGQGNLIAQPKVTVGQMEGWRKAISDATGQEPVDIRQASILKSLIDGQTEPLAGPLFRQARRARELYARQYENRALVSDLLSTKPRTADRKVALEDVFQRSILSSSLDDVRHLRRVLQTAGDEGQQAWRELQGATVNWIRDQSTRGVSTDHLNNPVVSAHGLNTSIRALEADGKLAFIFGKRGAEQLAAINDLAKLVLTFPPGTINSSNTASVLLSALGAFDGGFMVSTGIPAPIASSLRAIAAKVKDRRVQRRIDDALGVRKKQAPAREQRPTIH